MKRKLSILALLVGVFLYAQVPMGYYDGTAGLTGYQLKSKLSEIISKNYKDNGYSGLWETFKTSDLDKYYEKDETILDIYSENPFSTDAYNFKVGVDQCGAYKKEGDCYNREHIVPQSVFSKKSPMRNDAHFVLPTDGEVNNRRGTLPFGEVSNAIYTSKNGSKIGTNTTLGYAGQVFEPIDEFKGDIARTILYFATRYENQIPSFSITEILDGTSTQSITKWQLDVLLKWHNQDPVSQRERDRNEAIYKRQNNRNPYIDNPEWANIVWNYTETMPIIDNVAPTQPLNLVVGNITATTVDLVWEASTDNVGVIAYDVYVDGILRTTVSSNSATIVGLIENTKYSFYVVAKDAAGNQSEKSLIVEATAQKNTIINLPITGTSSCGTENFENIPAADSKYSDRIWENNGITWTATSARTDLANGNSREITFKKGTLTSSLIRDGIGSISVRTFLPYSDTKVIMSVKINGIEKGTIVVEKAKGTQGIWEIKSIDNINVEEEAILSLEVLSGRISLDDLTWTCYKSPDIQAPTVPLNLKLSNITTETVDLEWEASTDNVGVIAYDVYVNGILKTTVSGTSVTIIDLTPNTKYSFYVVARDAAGNQSANSENVVITTLIEKSLAPTVMVGKDVQIYPNPITQNGDMHFVNIGQNQSVKIYTMSGRLIREFNNVSDGDKINIGSVVKGVYLVVIGKQINKMIVRKIIVK